jgi:hypothetical protein
VAEIFVGSVAVGVVPNAKGFNEEMRRQLFPDADNIGREYGSKIGRGIQEAIRISIEKIKADLDKQGFKANVDADTTEAKDEIDSMRAEQEARPIKVKVEADSNSLRNFGKRLAAHVSSSLGNLGTGSLVGGGIFAGSSALLATAGPLSALLAGVGAFATVAVPEIKKVDAALGKTGTSAQKAWKQLTPPEKQLASSMKSVKDSFHDVSATVAPAVDRIVSLGANLVSHFMPTLALLARAGSRILGAFLRPLDQWISSNSFRVLIKEFADFGVQAAKLVGPWLTHLIAVLLRLFVQIAPQGIQVLQALLPLVTQLLLNLSPAIIIVSKLTAAVLKWLAAHHLLFPVLVATLGIIVLVTGATGLGGIIAATILVGLAISYLATHWRQIWADIKHWAEDAWNFLTHGWGQYLIPELVIIRGVVELVKEHWRQAWNLIKAVAQDAWNFLTHGWGRFLNPEIILIKYLVDTLRDHWRQDWNDIKNAAMAVWNFLYHNMFSLLIHLFLTDIPHAVQTGVGIIGRTWSTLKSIFGGPVSFLVNTVYDNGIARLWNDVMGHIGGPKLPVLKFARGGRLPGFGGGDIQPALLEPGETVVSKEHSRWLAPVFRAVGVPGYQGGGLVGNTVGFFSSIFGGVGDVAKLIAAIVTGNSTAAANVLSKFIHTPAAGDLATMMTGIPHAIVDQAIKFAISQLASLGGGGSGGFGGHGIIPTGPIQAYAKNLVLAVWHSMGEWLAFADIVGRESGWNVHATNPTSGAYGIPQALPGSKMASAGSDWQNNPFTQIRWMVGYIRDRWIDPIRADRNEVLAHWYDDGGWWPNGTIGINTSGHAEYVLTHEDMKHMGGTNYHAHFDGVTLSAHRAMVRAAFQEMDIGRGRLARIGRRQ